MVALHGKRFRNRRCLNDVVAGGVRAPAEAPTRVEHVEFHLFGLESGHVRDRKLVAGLELFAVPDFAVRWFSFTTQFNGSIAACAR